MWWKEKRNYKQISNGFKRCQSQPWKYCRKKFKVYAILFVLKIVKIEPSNKVQSFFPKKHAFNARKTLLFISFTSLIGMEWTKASLVDMDLSNTAQFSLIF
jgi:hypothetical protein